jgi:hypothetical protein
VVGDDRAGHGQAVGPAWRPGAGDRLARRLQRRQCDRAALSRVRTGAAAGCRRHPPALGRCGLAAAIYTALALETDADQALLLRRYRESLAAVKSAAERDAGATLGQQAALMLLLARAGDRTGRVEPPPVTPGPGSSPRPRTRAMPRSIAIIGIAPFAVRSVTAFDPGPPPAVGSAAASRDIAEVRTLGSSTGSTRSGEQTAAALFWNSGEPSDFSSMVRPVLEARKLDTLDIVRILALDALINIDGNIVTSVLKERYAHWRPEAAIAGPYAAAADAAKDWQGLVRSPNSPDYPSGRRDCRRRARDRAAAPLRHERPDRMAQRPDRPAAALAGCGGDGRGDVRIARLGRGAFPRLGRGRAPRRPAGRRRNPGPATAVALSPAQAGP